MDRAGLGNVASMGKLTGESSVEIDASIETVYAIVEDVLSAPEWQGGMRRMELVERDDQGRAVLVDAVADGKVKDITSRQRFTYDPPNSLRWKQEKGDFKDIEGSWELEALDDSRTKATYSLAADPGRVLSMAIRGPVELALRALLVNPRANELAKRVERG